MDIVDVMVGAFACFVFLAIVWLVGDIIADVSRYKYYQDTAARLSRHCFIQEKSELDLDGICETEAMKWVLTGEADK